LDRILSVTLGILLLSAGLSYAQSWGIFGGAGVAQGAASSVTPDVIAQASGCPTGGSSGTSGGCTGTPSLSFTGTSFFSSVLFIGDWLGAMAQFVSTFATVVPVPGQLLTAYTGGASSPLAPLAMMVNLGCWFDYFLFVVLFLRGGKVF
jgi:hypothetical protein